MDSYSYNRQTCEEFKDIKMFLIFQIEGKEQGVEVYYKDKTVWYPQNTIIMNGSKTL
jgi:hypothetical protein